ncbi:MAG: glycosyltransferase family 4 protein, partial [Candidatus Acidiferrales bacterium]
MRILILHDYGTLSGGAEMMVWRLREALRARGHQALLFTSTARPLPLPIVSDASCFGTVSPLRRVLQATNPHAYRRLRDMLRAFRPDVVHVKMFLTQLSPLVLPLLRSVPSLLHVINYNLICPINTKTLPSGAPCRHRPGTVCHATGCMSWPGVARIAVQRHLIDLDVFDHIVANSQWVAERLRAEGVRVDSWIHNGVPLQQQRPPLRDPPVVGFAGRLVSKKGVDMLLRAMPALLRRLPAARLLIAGDGPERLRLESLARELGIREAVAFLGHLEQAELERVLAPAWVQAVPSRWEEPFGLV